MIVPTTSPTNAPIEIQDVICYYKALNLKHGDKYQFDISTSDIGYTFKIVHCVEVKIGEFLLKVISYNTTIKMIFDLSTILKNKSCLVH